MSIKNILRWAAVVPTIFGGLVVGMLLVGLFNALQSWFLGADADSGYVKLVTNIFTPLAGGALAVYWAVKVAPAYRKIVSIISFSLILIVAIMLLLSNVDQGVREVIWAIVGSLSMAFGAGLVMYQIFEKGDDFKLLS